MSGLVNVQIDGFDQLVEKLTKLGNPRTTRRAMIAVHRPVLRPVVQAYREEIPERSAVLKSGPRAGQKQGQKNKYGPLPNLKKSVGIIAGRSPVNIRMYVGLRAGSRYKNDGWYGRMIHYGFQVKSTKREIPANPFADRAAQRSVPQANKKAVVLIERQVQKLIEKLSK